MLNMADSECFLVNDNTVDGNPLSNLERMALGRIELVQIQG